MFCLKHKHMLLLENQNPCESHSYLHVDNSYRMQKAKTFSSYSPIKNTDPLVQRALDDESVLKVYWVQSPELFDFSGHRSATRVATSTAIISSFIGYTSLMIAGVAIERTHHPLMRVRLLAPGLARLATGSGDLGEILHALRGQATRVEALLVVLLTILGTSHILLHC